MKKGLYLSLIALVCTASFALAMGGSGSAGSRTIRAFEGKVTDETGKPLSSVRVVLAPANDSLSCAADAKGAFTATTGSRGVYRFSAVRPGLYRVCYTVNGYQTYEKRVEIRQGSQDAIMNIELRSIPAK